MKERKCLECGGLLKGRADQKFCDSPCRSSYNNRKYRESHPFIRRINRTLKKNRKILKELNPNGKKTIHKNLMAQKGFDFTYHTHSFTNRNGQTYYFCYEQGYLHLKTDRCLLVNKEV